MAGAAALIKATRGFTQCVNPATVVGGAVEEVAGEAGRQQASLPGLLEEGPKGKCAWSSLWGCRVLEKVLSRIAFVKGVG